MANILQTPLPEPRPSLDLNLSSTSINSLTIKHTSYRFKVICSSPIAVPTSAGNSNPKVFDAFGINEVETAPFSIGTIPDSPGPLFESSVQRSITDHARLSQNTIPHNELHQGFARDPVPTPMPGTNLALDESYEIKSTSSKPLHGSLSLAGQTEQQNAMSYFTCLPDNGDHLIREDCYLPLGNVGAQNSLAEREPMRKLSTTLPTETSAYKRSVQSLMDPKSGHVNYVTGRWCSDDPFAPTPNSPTLSISNLKFDEPVLERRPQPLSKPSSLFKTTDLLPIPSSFPTMNSENSNRPRTGDSIQYVQLFLKMMFSQSNVKAKMILTQTPPIGSPMRPPRN